MNRVLTTHLFPTGQILQLVRGDITAERVDAIVNAANERLLHGGGVAGAISRRGGPAIQRESKAWVKEHGRVTHASPAYTSGGKLPCRYVIHAVGPVWGAGEEDQKLAEAVTGSLELAQQLELESIAFPAISTGIFGFPKERAAGVIIHAMREFLERNPHSTLKTIRLTLYDAKTARVFLHVWETLGLKSEQ